MLAKNLRVRISRQWRPPQLGLEAMSVDGVGDAAHVLGSVETAVCLPVTLGDLETVVHVHPLESEFLHLWKCAEDLIHSECPFISPCAPYGFKCLRLRCLRNIAFVCFHVFCELTERSEEVTLAN